ncbi:MAG TPA: GNAT family N-acetyltransferase [Kofleriaceae bacterium]|nr:GNAT family N-acetyltransferase [Kofleriaceae bacterium]
MSLRATMQRRIEREATGARSAWSVRAFDPERDADAVSHLDTSYTSPQAYAVHRSGDVVALAPTAITAPHSARAAFGPGTAPGPASAWTHARVAVLDGRVRGFLAWRCGPGGRMTIVQFHVDRSYRQRGGGRRLLDDALEAARGDGATLAWLETSSANHPAITAARRLGFEICGFDTTLYRGTPHQGEVAVFMAHPIDGDARG